MAAEIGNRPVLRPAGNIARASLRKAAKPATPPPLKAAVLAKRNTPPNSPPTTPKDPKEEAKTKGNPAIKPNVESPRSPESALGGSTGGGEDSAPAEEAKTGGERAPDAISTFKSTTSAAPTSKARAAPAPCKKKIIRVGGLSFDEEALAGIVAAKKAAASQVMAQKKLKVAEYGRKQEQRRKASRVAPDSPSPPSPSSAQLRRCKFITPQTDPLYVAYHDEEWGVPVHDDRMLFELLVLAGFQVELNWTTILHKRDSYRAAFVGFDAATVASFSEKYIQSLEADKDLALPKSKIRGAVENAKKILEVAREFGSLNDYLWGFLNKQQMVNNYRYPKQVPVKTSKSESISKDLVKRGFRFVGPTIIYSFMQAAGMTNDHLVQCFRHQECMRVSSPLASDSVHEESQEAKPHSQEKVISHKDEAGEGELENIDDLHQGWVSVQDKLPQQTETVSVTES